MNAQSFDVTEPAKLKQLTPNQARVLIALSSHGAWYAGCGWLWDTHSNTTRIMEALAKAGNATKTVEGDHVVYRPASAERAGATA